jgi:bifunctional non-homologous end joining protein LigD
MAQQQKRRRKRKGPPQKGSAFKKAGQENADQNKKKDSREDKEKTLGRKGPLPKFVEPQLCRIVAAPPGNSGWEHEVKFDGYRLEIRIENGKARLLTRRGLDWTGRFPEIATAGNALPDCLVDGEVIALNADGVSDFSKLQAALSEKKTSSLVYFAFDLLWANGRDLRSEPLSQRKEALLEILKRQASRAHRIRYVEHFTSSGDAMLEAACRMNLEGVISKRLDAPYHSGRNDSWTKSKCRGGQEVVIGGWWGGDNELRSLLVGAHRNGKFIYLGRVGTGYNTRNTPPLLKTLRPLKRKTSPFEGAQAPPRQRGVIWVEPKLVAEVEFGTITAAGLLRQASYKGLREDKPALSVVPEAQPGAKHEGRADLAKAKSGTHSKHDAEVSGIVITHPDKPLWPKSGKIRAITKLDLARYYEAAAKRILPHIEGRPISMVRAPDGIEGQQFFQRHAMKGGPKFRPMKVPGEEQPYVAIDDEEGLVSLAQAGVLEIHPWGSGKDKPLTPARIIFDLDPAPDVTFDRVIAGAKELKKRIEALGLEAFVKTTGGKGIHVVTPVKGTPAKPITWADAKAFAKALCVQMEEDEPRSYTTTISKSARGGKIFLDYLRNDKTSTAVAPWSPRARPGATISMPLEWKALRAGLDPKAFNILAAGKLLKRTDPWAKIDAAAKALAPAMKKLQR